MMPLLMSGTPVLLGLLACKTEEKTEVYELGSLEVEHATDSGTEVVGADVITTEAFGYSRDGHALVYFAGQPGHSCEDVSEYLSGDGGDPSHILAPHTCEVSIKVENIYDAAGFSTSSKMEATVVLGCAFDEGAWEYGSMDQGDEGYFYSGPWWQGFPDSSFSLELSGGEGEDFEMTLEINDFDGSFSYEGFNDAVATGAVSGTLPVTWCEGMVDAQIFPG